MTGNVSGGKHFRGVVPYGSPYEFQGSQGSSTLNDFYRRTSGLDLENTGSSSSVFSLPSKSVTAFRRDQQYQLNAPSAVKNQLNLGRVEPEKIELQKTELRPVLSEISGVRPLVSPLEDKQYGLEKYLLQNQQKESEIPEKAENLVDNKLADIPTNLPETPFEVKEVKAEDKTIENQPNVYIQMLESLQKKFEEDIVAKHTENLKLQAEEKAKAEEKRRQDLEEIAKMLREKRAGSKNISKDDSESAAVLDDQEELPETFKTFADNSADRFNQYMKTAEELMKIGEYYKAADAYSLASAYNNQNPLAYAGQTHCLFAAGEYMSSSYYLSRTLKIFGYYALLKIDIKKMIGNDDLFEKRLQELVSIQEKSGSPEIETLLAYIYKNIGDNDRALDYINLAIRKSPEEPSIEILYDAITNPI